MEELGDGVADGVRDVGEGVGNAVEDVGDAVDNAAKWKINKKIEVKMKKVLNEREVFHSTPFCDMISINL